MEWNHQHNQATSQSINATNLVGLATEMGWINATKLKMENESESNQPLTSSSSPCNSHDPIPKDDYNIGYAIFFILGAGFLLPWNCFVSAVDYFQILYPNSHTDRVFSLAYMIPCLACLLGLTFCGQHCLSPRGRINAGISTFLVILVLMLIMDEVWITGDKGTKTTHSLTVGASTVLGVADALVQASLIGSAAELPERYMQASVAGTAAAGLQFVSSFVIFFLTFCLCVCLYWIWYPNCGVDSPFNEKIPSLFEWFELSEAHVLVGSFMPLLVIYNVRGEFQVVFEPPSFGGLKHRCLTLIKSSLYKNKFHGIIYIHW